MKKAAKETKAVEIYNDEPRTGSFIISQGFERDHFKVLRLIEKYKDDFIKLETSQREKLLSRRIPIKTAGRPVDEFLLNNNQVLFLISLLRSTGLMVSFKRKALQAGTITAILEALQNFDFEESNLRYVYAVMDSRQRVKIGISNNPERRLKELNIGNADPLTLIFTKQTDKPNYQSETEIHNNGKDFRIRSEWFTASILDILGIELPCTAKTNGEVCECKKCKEFSDISDVVIFSRIDNPEEHQQKIKQIIIEAGFSQKQAQNHLDIWNEIGWPV